MKLPSSVTVLDAFVVAEHPAGHRLFGRVRGAGTLGVAFTVHGVRRPVYLSYDEGWSIRRTEDTPHRTTDPAASAPDPAADAASTSPAAGGDT